MQLGKPCLQCLRRFKLEVKSSTLLYELAL
jgi:hypothetical protein